VSERGREVLMDFYRAFNNRDAEAATGRMAPDVDWPDEATGGRITGPSAVRRAFETEWRESDPRLEPTAIDFDGEGRAHVRVHELVRSPGGDILQDRKIEHVFTFDGAFIARLDVIERDPDPEAEEDDEDD
jgi:ketosteroid isomerase-like protein